MLAGLSFCAGCRIFKDSMSDLLETIKKVGSHFAVSGELIDGEELVTGLINQTFLAVYENEEGVVSKYVLQRVNEHVFTDPRQVMRNIERVTKHINDKVFKTKRSSHGQTLRICPSRNGESCIEGEKGGIWRCYHYIEGCQTIDVAETTNQAFQAGRAFGEFQDLLSDFPVSKVSVTIADFHNTPVRYQRLLEVIKADSHGRAKGVETVIQDFLGREPITAVLMDHLKAGRLVERVTHNDTKINNVMLNAETDDAVCVIDLDTVMPGLSLYDFGDLIRSGTSPVDEDERDCSLVEMRMPMFEAIASGYLSAAHRFLSDLEVELMPMAAKVITMETGIRFLTDYLEGDVYFKTSREGHNLDRARVQMALLKSIEAQEGQMKLFVKNWRPA